mmetsp:Transcript_104797/g.293752  ORF Transcript_104797/g.293752 Transcript_104797/m.293752 type:complete len:202 (-) Transcript_104797:4-609(-)
MPRSFMSVSSMSQRVSKSSKPLRSKVFAYWPRPASSRKRTTGWFGSDSACPVDPCRCISWSFRRKRMVWNAGMPNSFMSVSSMAIKVSRSSKPLRKKWSAYCSKPISLRKTTTSLFSSMLRAPGCCCGCEGPRPPRRDPAEGRAPPAVKDVPGLCAAGRRPSAPALGFVDNCPECNIAAAVPICGTLGGLPGLAGGSGRQA